MASRLLRCAGFVALTLAVYAIMPYVLRAMLLAADGVRVVLGMGSVLWPAGDSRSPSRSRRASSAIGSTGAMHGCTPPTRR